MCVSIKPKFRANQPTIVYLQQVNSKKNTLIINTLKIQNIMEEKVTVLAKRKNTTFLFDYLMDQKVVFTISPRPMISDEFEVDVQISNIKQAIALGMFLKENKYEVFGLGEFTKVKTAPNNSGAKKSDVKSDLNQSNATEENAPLLNF